LFSDKKDALKMIILENRGKPTIFASLIIEKLSISGA